MKTNLDLGKKASNVHCDEGVCNSGTCRLLKVRLEKKKKSKPGCGDLQTNGMKVQVTERDCFGGQSFREGHCSGAVLDVPMFNFKRKSRSRMIRDVRQVWLNKVLQLIYGTKNANLDSLHSGCVGKQGRFPLSVKSHNGRVSLCSKPQDKKRQGFSFSF